jgi:hypothetical protein
MVNNSLLSATSTTESRHREKGADIAVCRRPAERSNCQNSTRRKSGKVLHGRALRISLSRCHAERSEASAVVLPNFRIGGNSGAIMERYELDCFHAGAWEK